MEEIKKKNIPGHAARWGELDGAIFLLGMCEEVIARLLAREAFCQKKSFVSIQRVKWY